MAGAEGVALLQRLRTQMFTPTPSVALCGFGPNLEQATRWATAIVRKPFDINALQELVNQAAAKLPADA